MSSYPLSSLPQNRLCFLYADEVCPTYPCAHTPCHDPDLLEEEEDHLRDYDFVIELWCCYDSLNNASSMLEKKAQTPPERWAAFELKFDRCRRIEAKQEKIDRDMKEWNQRQRAESVRVMLAYPEEFGGEAYLQERLRKMMKQERDSKL